MARLGHRPVALLLLSVVACASAFAQTDTEMGAPGHIEVGEFQGRLSLGGYSRVADAGAEQLAAWSSTGDLFGREQRDSPDPTAVGAVGWRRNMGAKLFLDSPSRVSWIAIEMVNSTGEERDYLLEMTGAQGVGWRYRDHRGHLVSYLDDFDVRTAGRPIYDASPIIPLRLAPDFHYRLLIAAYTVQDAAFVDFSLWHPEDFRAQRLRQHVIDGAYFGLVIALIVYNLFLFFALRQYTYIFFSLFMAASGGMIYVGSGLSSVVGLHNPVPLSLPLALMFLGGVGVFGALFSVSLLNIRNTNGSLFRAWMVVVALHVAVTPITIYFSSDLPGEGVGPALLLVLIAGVATQGASIATVVHYWARSIIARYWFLGITMHTLMLVSWPVLLNTSTDLVVEPYNLAQFWMLVDTVLLSALIAYNIRLEQSARVEAQNKAVENLRLAHEVERAKSNFVATVGHDLRGPVQAISHFVQSLKTTTTEGSLQGLQKIDENVDAISELLDAMVKLSETEWQATNQSLAPVSLPQLLAELRNEFSARAAQKHIALELDVAPSVVMSDKVCLSQILRNLIDNAIKYTTEGRVSVRVAEAPDGVRITVADTGCGMPEHALPHIFDEFYQVRRTGRDGGVGLGLSIVARLTRLLGIEVEVSSRYLIGSTFELRMQAETSIESPVPATPDHRAEVAVPVSASLAGIQVLVIDDDRGGLGRLVDMLTGWGADVTCLQSLSQGTSHLTQHHTELILSAFEPYQTIIRTRGTDGLPTDTTVFVLDDPALDQGLVARENHIVIDATIESMRFRSLIQRNVDVTVP